MAFDGLLVTEARSVTHLASFSGFNRFSPVRPVVWYQTWYEPEGGMISGKLTKRPIASVGPGGHGDGSGLHLIVAPKLRSGNVPLGVRFKGRAFEPRRGAAKARRASWNGRNLSAILNNT